MPELFEDKIEIRKIADPWMTFESPLKAIVAI